MSANLPADKKKILHFHHTGEGGSLFRMPAAASLGQASPGCGRNPTRVTR